MGKSGQNLRCSLQTAHFWHNISTFFSRSQSIDVQCRNLEHVHPTYLSLIACVGTYFESAFLVILRLRTRDRSPILSILIFFVLLGLLDGVAVLTSSLGWVRSSTTLPLLISCFPLHRSSSSHASVVVLMSLCGCRSRGWHSTDAFVSPNISSPQSILSSTPGLPLTQLPSHYSGSCFRLPHPVPALRSVPTLHQSNLCCPLVLFPHILLGAHRRSPSVYSCLSASFSFTPPSELGHLFPLTAMSAHDTLGNLVVSNTTLRLLGQTLLKCPVSPQP